MLYPRRFPSPKPKTLCCHASVTSMKMMYIIVQKTETMATFAFWSDIHFLFFNFNQLLIGVESRDESECEQSFLLRWRSNQKQLNIRQKKMQFFTDTVLERSARCAIFGTHWKEVEDV